MNSVIVKSGVAVGCIVTLVATGGTVDQSPLYETFNSTAVQTSTLAGTAIRSNGSTAALNVTNVNGTLTHNTGAMTVDDATYALTDSNGFDASDVLSDGTATISVNNSPISTSTYDYVIGYDQSYSSGGVNYDSTGFLGVATRAADVPSTGSATYTGAADATITSGGTALRLTSGTSTVAADFAAGTADLTMTGFTSATPASIDTISATAMTITGSAFTGSTVTTTNSGANVDLTGANTTANASGNLFGFDTANSIPDEVAGVILMQGDSGIITGAFIAD